MSLSSVVQARLAEKLTILNERAEGLLARLHYIKKVNRHTGWQVRALPSLLLVQVKQVC